MHMLQFSKNSDSMLYSASLVRDWEHQQVTNKVLRFGVFELDVHDGSLRKHGSLVRLQVQPARVLLHLIERHGQVVSREELHQALWPADTFVDFDHGLNTVVNKIRDA